MPHSRARRSLVPALAAAALLALTGCGGAVTDAAPEPRTAARIGDVEISRAEVDRTADAICADLEPQFVDAGAPVTMGQVRQYALSLLAARAQAEQVAAEYDVRPGPEVTADLNQWKQRAELVPDDLVDEFATAMNTEVLLTSLLSQAGEASLRADGVRNPSEDRVMQRGSELFSGWAQDADVTIDPRYGVDVVEGSLQPAETGVSVPVSARAVQAWAAVNDPQNADPDYVASLPESQRCG